MGRFSNEPPSFSVHLRTPYGDFVMARHDAHQPVSILRTGVPHIAEEIDTLVQIVGRLPPKALVLDVGANIGLISIPLARELARSGGSLLAFEPQRVIYYMLAGNVVLNGLQNVHCHQLAVSDHEGTLAISPVDYYQPQDFGMVQMHPVGSTAPGEERVQAITIDMLDLAHVDLIKIDVEEMELKVLAGATSTIARARPLLWVEAWPRQRGAIFEFLQRLDYELFIADELNFFCAPRERLDAGYAVAMMRFDGVNHPFL